MARGNGGRRGGQVEAGVICRNACAASRAAITGSIGGPRGRHSGHRLLQLPPVLPWPSSISRSSSSRAACWPPRSATTPSCATTASRWISSPASSSRCISATPTAPRPSAAIRWRPSTTTRWARARPSRSRSATCPAARPRRCSRAWTTTASVDASGPFGRFCLMPADANQRYLLIGTGTGVTPYRAMLPQLDALIRERGIQVVLLFGARTPVELLYGDEFRAFADKHPQHFRFVPCFSRELPDRLAHARRASRLRAAVPRRVRAERRRATSPTCAATRTWSTPASRRSRAMGWRCRRSAARSTSAASSCRPLWERLQPRRTPGR